MAITIVVPCAAIDVIHPYSIIPSLECIDGQKLQKGCTMPLVEAVTIELGAAIAKSILKLWVKDSSLGEDIAFSLIDLFKARTSDALAQQRGRRQFEAIGEKVGESLLPLFEIEGARLDEGSRTAVALAVAEAFNKTKLTSALLAQHNLEPTELARHVLAAHPTATDLFSAAETAFYERIINESCGYMVDIASQLPTFSVILQHIVAKMSAISFTKRAARYTSQGGFELKCETSRHLSWLVRSVRGKAPHPAPIFSSWLG